MKMCISLSTFYIYICRHSGERERTGKVSFLKNINRSVTSSTDTDMKSDFMNFTSVQL